MSATRSYRNLRFSASLLTLAILAACGGGGPPQATIASIAITVRGVAVAGVSASFPVIVTAKDASGNTITGNYPASITLTDSDTSGATSLSTSIVTNSSTTVNLVYKGSPSVASITLSASAPGVAASSISGATFTPNSQHVQIGGGQYTYSRTFQVTSIIIPAPGIAPTTTTDSSSETSVVSFIDGASFNNQNNLVDVHEANTDATRGLVDTLDSYLALNQTNTGVALLEVASVVNGPGTPPSFQSIALLTPGSIVDELPQSDGATWSPASAFTLTNTMTSSNETQSNFEQFAADGSGTFSGSGTFNLGTSAQEFLTNSSTFNTDGTATDVNGVYAAGGLTNSLETDSFGVPTNGSIPVQINCQTGAATLPSPPPTMSSAPGPSCTDAMGNSVTTSNFTVNVPNWHATFQLPLDQEKTTVIGAAALPSTCIIGNTVSGANLTREHVMSQTLSPDSGITTGSTDFYYQAGVGTICEIDSLDTKFYDALKTGALVSEETSLMTTALQSAILPQSTTRRPMNAAKNLTVRAINAVLLARSVSNAQQRTLALRRRTIQSRLHRR